MPLIDSSAWIDFLRGHDSTAADSVAVALADGSAAVTDVVVLEVLSGTTDVTTLARWEGLFARCDHLDQVARLDVETAADLYRTCRRAGETPRSPNDCLVAAVAIRHDVDLLHRDRDFEVIARHSALRLVAV